MTPDQKTKLLTELEETLTSLDDNIYALERDGGDPGLIDKLKRNAAEVRALIDYGTEPPLKTETVRDTPLPPPPVQEESARKERSDEVMWWEEVMRIRKLLERVLTKADFHKINHIHPRPNKYLPRWIHDFFLDYGKRVGELRLSHLYHLVYNRCKSYGPLDSDASVVAELDSCRPAPEPPVQKKETGVIAFIESKIRRHSTETFNKGAEHFWRRLLTCFKTEQPVSVINERIAECTQRGHNDPDLYALIIETLEQLKGER